MSRRSKYNWIDLVVILQTL